MEHICQLNDQTKQYLERFYSILDEMICNMTKAELTQSISHNFIVQMIPHHRAAIEMSQNILHYTTCQPLRRIASHIISSQTKSIEDMEKLLPSCSQLCNPQRDLQLYQRRTDLILRTMFSEMGSAPETNDIDADFLREMIPHHQGAIGMSRNALHYDLCPGLIPPIRAIITSQRRGVREMEALLRCIARPQ